MKGLYANEITDIDMLGLGEIKELDNQLLGILDEIILDLVKFGRKEEAISRIEILRQDTATHMEEIKIAMDYHDSEISKQEIISILNSFHITDPTEVSICLKDIQSRGLTTEDEISQYVDEYFTGIENSV